MNPIDEMIQSIARNSARRTLDDGVSVHIENSKEYRGLEVKMSGTSTGFITALGAMVSGMRQAGIPASVIRVAVETVLSDDTL